MELPQNPKCGTAERALALFLTPRAHQRENNLTKNAPLILWFNALAIRVDIYAINFKTCHFFSINFDSFLTH